MSNSTPFFGGIGDFFSGLGTDASQLRDPQAAVAGGYLYQIDSLGAVLGVPMQPTYPAQVQANEAMVGADASALGTAVHDSLPSLPSLPSLDPSLKVLEAVLPLLLLVGAAIVVSSAFE